MKIERIDDKTVKCFLSNEELEEYDIDYKDFVTRSDKAKEVVQEIIEQAEEEVGYKPPKYAFDLQIMMLPDEGLVLVLSEKEPLENKSGAQLLQALQEMKRVFEEKKAEIGAAEKKAQAGENAGESGNCFGYHTFYTTGVCKSCISGNFKKNQLAKRAWRNKNG